MIEQEEIQRRLDTFLDLYRGFSEEYLTGSVRRSFLEDRFLPTERRDRSFLAGIITHCLRESELSEVLLLDEAYEYLQSLMVYAGIDFKLAASLFVVFSDQRKKLQAKERRTQNDVEFVYAAFWEQLTEKQKKVALIILLINDQDEPITEIQKLTNEIDITREDVIEALNHFTSMGLMELQDGRINLKLPDFFNHILVNGKYFNLA